MCGEYETEVSVFPATLLVNVAAEIVSRLILANAVPVSDGGQTFSQSQASKLAGFQLCL